MNSTTTKEVPVLNLNFKEAFLQLNDKEKNYAYELSQACWQGRPIVLFQISYESPALFVIFQMFFGSFKPLKDINEKIKKENNTITDDDIKAFLNYAAQCLSNAGNYVSFGHKKFIPLLAQEKFEQIVKTSKSYGEFEAIWNKIKDIIYDNSDKCNTINLEEKGGKNSYYLGGIKEEEIKLVDKYLMEKNIDPLNTRLLKVKEDKYVVLIGSVDTKTEQWTDKITAYYGDFSAFLSRINKHLEEAKKYCYNETEKKMLDFYIESFNTGSIEKHKESQRQWVRDKKPLIETNIGWIETYVDPMGVRGYYEGFVALTDKEKSKKFNTLVSKAEQFIATFPWDKGFEKPVFKSPDFIALDLLCFASKSCPVGINIPNYQDVQETDGFKNISLSNAYIPLKREKIKYCSEEDKDILVKFEHIASIVKVAGHELLGHGSGLLLRQTGDKYNFEKGKLINPLTNQPVDKFYVNNETYESKFTSIGRSMEECRADLVGHFFGFNKEVQKIFEIKEEDYETVIYTMWMAQFRKGTLGLPLYSKENKKWGQAHTQGAWVFTRFILENQPKGEEIIKIELDEPNKTFMIKVNKENLMKHGKALIEKILTHIHIYKSTGDYENAKVFYDKYSEVDEYYLKIREILLANEKPRRIELYHNLKVNEDKTISIVEYPDTVQGVIESYVDRYGNDFNKEILEQWTRYDKMFI